MIRALFFPDHDAFVDAAHPGSFHLQERAAQGLHEFVYFCPCGCGIKGRLLVGVGFKPGGNRPSWVWCGSKTEPTLNPSVHHEGHWHGWLRHGYWEKV